MRGLVNYPQVFHPQYCLRNLIKIQRAMRNNIFSFIFIIKFIIFLPTILSSASSKVELMEQKWPFNGIFGRFDESSLQRGFQVYREVCAACHGIRHISYRDLKGIGYTNDEIKIIAG